MFLLVFSGISLALNIKALSSVANIYFISSYICIPTIPSEYVAFDNFVLLVLVLYDDNGTFATLPFSYAINISSE